MGHSPREMELLQLLKELQEILANALSSLGGKFPKTPEAHYMGFVAIAINEAADGYLVLRQGYRLKASKLMIRPALEVLLGGIAVENNPGLLVRKAYSEWEEWGKMLKDPKNKAEHEQRWNEFEIAVKNQDPGCVIVREHLSVRKIAELAGMLPHYERSYRLYCKFTHGALGAIKGSLDPITDESDSSVMIWCVSQAIALLERQTPAILPDMNHLGERVERILFKP